jgi:DNA mismatch repair protein MSH5
VFVGQVAVVVYLAHVGSFVPAASARISIVDKIFTRINSEESVSSCMSSFCFDLNQVLGGFQGQKDNFVDENDYR